MHGLPSTAAQQLAVEGCERRPLQEQSRVVACGVGAASPTCELGSARIFADQPVHERAKGRPPLPQTGRELSEAHRSLPWEEYLHPSDHFGIFVELQVF